MSHHIFKAPTVRPPSIQPAEHRQITSAHHDWKWLALTLLIICRSALAVSPWVIHNNATNGVTMTAATATNLTAVFPCPATFHYVADKTIGGMIRRTDNISARFRLSFVMQSGFQGAWRVGYLDTENYESSTLDSMGLRIMEPFTEQLGTMRVYPSISHDGAVLLGDALSLSQTNQWDIGFTWSPTGGIYGFGNLLVSATNVNTLAVVTNSLSPTDYYRGFGVNAFGMWAGFNSPTTNKTVTVTMDSPTYTTLPKPSALPANGKVFILASQSNARGGDAGETNQVAMSNFVGTNVFYFRHGDLEWTYGRPGSAFNNNFGPWPTFAGGYAAEKGEPVFIIEATKGGTPLTEFLPAANNLYPVLTNAAKTALALLTTPQIKAVLFVGGESDADVESRATNYQANFNTFMSALKTDLATPGLTNVITRLHSWATNNGAALPYSAQVRAAQTNIGHWVNTDDFTGAATTDGPDPIHYSTGSQFTNGWRLLTEWFSIENGSSSRAAAAGAQYPMLVPDKATLATLNPNGKSIVLLTDGSGLFLRVKPSYLPTNSLNVIKPTAFEGERWLALSTVPGISIDTLMALDDPIALSALARVATDTILGRTTTGTGSVETLTALPFADTGDVTRPADSAVTTIATLAVTTAKLNDLAVTNGKIGLLAVDTPQIQVGAVTGSRIADGTIGTVDIGDNQVTKQKIEGIGDGTFLGRLPSGSGGNVSEVPLLSMLAFYPTNTSQQKIWIRTGTTNNGVASSLTFWGTIGATNTSTNIDIVIGGSSGTSVYVNGSSVSNPNFADTSTAILSKTATTNIGVYPTNLADAQISATAAIARSKVASGTAAHVIINDGSGNLSSEAQLGAARFPALTGDVTTSAGSLATTIAPLAVTNGKIGLLAVDTPQLQVGSVTGSRIADGTIGTVDIGDAQVTKAKIEGVGQGIFFARLNGIGSGTLQEVPWTNVVTDVAFAAAWNNLTTVAPSANAVYDWGHTFDTDDDGKVNVLDMGAGLVKTDSGGVVSAAAAGTDYVAPSGAGAISGLTTGTIPKAAAGSTLADSPLIVSAVTNVTLTGNLLANGVAATNTLTLNGTSVSDAAILASGTVGTARLGSGSATSSTYLRGDQTWAAISGSSVYLNGSSVSNPNLADSSTAVFVVSATTNISVYPTNLGSAQISASAAIPLTKLASSTSAQLATLISDETGTGAAVFATSPALVAPSITNNNGSGITFTGGQIILAPDTNTTAVTISARAIGTGITNGISLINTNRADNGAQQDSPQLRMEVQAFKSNATTNSQRGGWDMKATGVQGTSVSSTRFLMKPFANDAYTGNDFTFTSAGDLSMMGTLTLSQGGGVITLGSSSGAINANGGITGGAFVQAFNSGTWSWPARDVIASSADGALEVFNNASSAISTIRGNIPSTNNTANFTLLALHSGYLFKNTSATSAVTNTLPTAAAGMHVWGLNDTNFNFAFKASGSDVIKWGSTTSAAADVIWTGTMGHAIHLYSPRALVWQVDSTSGDDWTLVAPRSGNAVLVGGTVTVANTTITANSEIQLSRKTAGGTLGAGGYTYTLSAGTSFTIQSDDLTGALATLDTSTITYTIRK